MTNAEESSNSKEQSAVLEGIPFLSYVLRFQLIVYFNTFLGEKYLYSSSNPHTTAQKSQNSALHELVSSMVPPSLNNETLFRERIESKACL